MVYVISADGTPLMPTNNHAKVRKLLKSGKAVVVKRIPFTIQLKYDTTKYVQPISLGVDAGSKHIGLSATTNDKVLYEADVELRNDIVELLSTRRECRRTRRNRKTRYRKPRFNNRKSSKPDGWIAPSVKQKIETHLTVIKKIHEILPITNIVVEVASFDIQKIKNPEISGDEYQHGEQLGFWNVREYVLFRDNHTCQCCKGKSGCKILNVHHIESRKTGGNAPNDLITLCEYCHGKYHAGELKLPSYIKRGMSFRDAIFMAIMRWSFYNRLKDLYHNVSLTYGYITKNTRIKNDLPKEHYIDARCISGNPTAKSNGIVYYQKKIRRHNRKIYKDKILCGNTKKRNQCPYMVFGFHRYDIVLYLGRICYINSLRDCGYFQLKDLTDPKFKKELSFKKLKLIRHRNSFVASLVKI